MNKSNYEMTVCINGKSVREYIKDGKSFIEAKSGSTYSLKLKNNTLSRTMVVISVDGIDVISGKSAHNAQNGYIVNALSTVEIKGFRVDSETEASFKFFEKGSGNGYAEHKGDSSSVGVIGVRFYEEKITPPKIYYTESNPFDSWKSPKNDWMDHTYRTKVGGYGSTLRSTGDFTEHHYGSTINDMASYDNSSTVASANFMSFGSTVETKTSNDVKPQGFDMTTGWGHSVESKVTEVDFKKGRLATQMEILYASKESLKQMGIVFENVQQITVPSAFGKSLNFCEPPSNWKR